ncbi:hypothetical protein DL89DRAFT_174320 [Linderina pennispora]|uniref:Cytochrome P450 n=1 Tax=Linderina pennispora TaxID=61395 RepID=A0A1Y1W6W6_9FUNG|nr:uncharacterized protein DL89DRAFT_174320 [Linderina pennispora]ORX69290.1 hypothetical protein DL89DRAFT_174320 [Linderina pennispora]
MILEHILGALQRPIGSATFWPVITLVVAVYVARLIRHAFFTPLARIPRPFMNRLSNLPLMYKLFCGQYHSYSTELHEKYGEVVRIGHDHISLSSTSDTRLVLATHAFRKGRMYEDIVNCGAVLDTFSTTDPEINKLRRRQIGDAFSMRTMCNVESLVVDTGVSSLMNTWDSDISKQGEAARVNYFYSFHCMATTSSASCSLVQDLPL